MTGHDSRRAGPPPASGPPMTMPPPASPPLEPYEVTFGTLRDWAERAVRTPVADRLSHAAGFARAASDVLAILDMHGRPAGEPVVFRSSLDC